MNSIRFIGVIVAITCFSLTSYAQRQTRLYIDDSTGNFTTLQVPTGSGGGTITLPSGTGTLSFGGGLPTGAIVIFADNGAHSGFTYTGSTLSVTNDAWAPKTSMLTARFSLAAAAPGNGKIYVVGGTPDGSTTVLGTCEEYDPVGNSWATKTSMSVPRADLAAAAPGDGKLYAIGGFDGSIASAVCEQYDPGSDTWTTENPMPTPRADPAAASPGDGKIYVVGGADEDDDYLTTCEQFDPVGNSWTTKSPMTVGRAGLAAAAPGNGKFYAIGGYYFSDGTYFESSACEEYDPTGDTWTSKADMPTARDGLAAGVPGDGKIYAVGGENLAEEPYAINEQFDPSANVWNSKSSMVTALMYLAAAAPANGKFYIFGGTPDYSTPTATCAEYTPGPSLYLFSKN